MSSALTIPGPLKSFLKAIRGATGNLLFSHVVDVVKRTDADLDPEALWKLASRGFYGLICPIQNRAEILALLRLLRQSRPKTVLEIGTARGGTLFMFTRVAAADARLISLDLPGGPGGGGYAERRIPLYQSFSLPGQELELVRADSHDPEVFRRIRDGLKADLLDFLFIDGDHSYEGVKQDFEMYGPLVKPGGVIAFHDIVYGQDVARFWNEIKSTRRVEEFIGEAGHAFGIGVVHV